MGIPLALATLPEFVEELLALSPLTGDGDSSFDFRFSGRGGRNAVGEVLGVFVAPPQPLPPLPPPEDDEDDDELPPLPPPPPPLAVLVVVVFVVEVAPELVRDAARPLAAPLRNLE